MAPPEKDDKTLTDELVKQDLITREELAQAQEREEKTGTPVFRQLIQLKKLSFGALDDILRHEFHPKSVREEHQSLGQTLVEMKAISREQLNQALAEQNRSGRLLGNILLDAGFVTRQTIAMALSKQYGLEYAELHKTPSEVEALESVPESMARKNQMIPVRLEGDRLVVLIPSPQVRSVINDVSVLLGVRIYPVLTSSDDIRAEIAARYDALRRGRIQVRDTGAEAKTKKKPSEAAKTPARTEEAKPKKKNEAKGPAVMPEPVANQKQNHDAGRFDEIAREASGVPVIKLVQTIIEGAANSGATDIHLDPQEPEMRVRYRIDGVLHDVMSIPADTEAAVISRIKIMSDMDITETRHPQDGHISLQMTDKDFDIRVATLPTYLGERVVLRMLEQSSVLAGIKDLGLESDDEKKMMNIIAQPYGMILVTGPTGSGKTTSLYAALNQKNVLTDSIVTLEDPVEYQLSGINQVQIDTDIDLTFASTLRAALRQDIDVLLVGEIRDPETAHIAIRAAMTGHLVFSTLHTNDALEAITTLRNMGIAPYLIASALTAVVAQRLVRKICPECKTPVTPTKALLKSIGLTEATKKVYKGKGCDACYHTGNKGRTGIFEVLEITPDIRKLIADEASIDAITKAAKLKTMADRCRQKVKDGVVDPDEFLRVIRI